MRILFFSIAILFSIPSQAQKGKKENFDDDLSPYVITYEVSNDSITPVKKLDTITPTYHVNQEMIAFTDSLGNLYKNANLNFKGFRILVYNGNNNEEAKKTHSNLRRLYPDKCVYKDFSITFKVKIGNFRDRLVAHSMFMELKKKYPRALLINDNIEIDCLH